MEAEQSHYQSNVPNESNPVVSTLPTMNYVQQLALLKDEEEALLKQKRKLNELLYKLTVEEVELRKSKKS